ELTRKLWWALSGSYFSSSTTSIPTSVGSRSIGLGKASYSRTKVRAATWLKTSMFGGTVMLLCGLTPELSGLRAAPNNATRSEHCWVRTAGPLERLVSAHPTYVKAMTATVACAATPREAAPSRVEVG